MRGGRLGNQFFQYAFARQLKASNPGQEIRINFDDVVGEEGEIGYGNSLKDFNVPEAEAYYSDSKERNIIQKLLMKFFWHFLPNTPYAKMAAKQRFQRKWAKLFAFFGIYICDYGYYPFPMKKPWWLRNIFLFGTFESDKFFPDIRHILLEEFTPKFPKREENKELFDAIENKNSVAVSVRRGDFVKQNEVGRVHNVCSVDYFKRAIALMREKVDNPTFIFFSDDIEWVKTTFKLDAECYYENGNDPVWEKIRELSSCKHFIISNSTFAWWGQYLGRNPDKIVIAPNKWFNSDIVPEIFQDNWIRIEV